MQLNLNLWQRIKWRLKKPVRTMQSYFPYLKDTKDSFYLSYRGLFGISNEPFFAAIALFADRFTGCYVDVGGNIGQSIEAIKLYASSANILSFEPNPSLAAKLISRYRNDPRIEIRAIGLSDKAGRMTLYVPSYRGFVYDGLGSLDFDTAKSWISNETVYFFRPDRLVINSYDCAVETIDMQNIQDPIFIKIDVQETEYDVFKGGIETIRKFEPIILVEDFHEKPDLIQLSSELGYRPYTFDGQSFVLGASDTSTFLITPGRMDAIMGPRLNSPRHFASA
jgi:FkbM family methyltransferase